MIHLTKSGMVGTANIEELARQFECSSVFRLPQLLHPDLIRKILPLLQSCTWVPSKHGEVGTEEIPLEPTCDSILYLVLNTPEFLELIRQITRRSDSKWFSGRVFRMSRSHFDSWHSDLGEPPNRLVGMSINLSPRPYAGGVFQLRNAATGRRLCELPNTGLGDAICFRISPSLRHMVTRVVSIEPRVAFAGWFLSGDADFYSMVRRARAIASPD